MKKPVLLTLSALALGFAGSALPLSGADAPAAPAATAPAAKAAPAPAKTETPTAKSAPAAPADLKTPAPATPENAVAFLGDWTLDLEGPNGPAAINVTLKNTDGKVTGSLSSEMQANQTFAEIVRLGTGLVMRYTLDFQGNSIDAEVTFTPAGEKMNAKASFAAGAFVLDGTASKKAK